jgi:hypothetical protein
MNIFKYLSTKSLCIIHLCIFYTGKYGMLILAYDVVHHFLCYK